MFGIRRLIKSEREIETYLGIQRQLNPKRVIEIAEYTHTVGATFPTSVIISVEERCTSLEYINQETGVATLTLDNFLDTEDEEQIVYYRNIAKVIDGQHRILGLKEYEEGDFEINVVVFIGADISDQANVFATVNLSQTKVNKSLVYDLFSLSEVRSPQKTCHEIVVALDLTRESPFFKKIRRLGLATQGRVGESLSQATVVDMMLPLISINPRLDRDAAMRGRRLNRAEGNMLFKLVFRNIFIDKEDVKISDNIWNYFSAVRDRWPGAWNFIGTGLILNRTNGFRGFMRFFRPAYLHYTAPGSVVDSDSFLELFKKVDLKDADFNVETFKPGTSGETSLYHKLTADTSVELN